MLLWDKMTLWGQNYIAEQNVTVWERSITKKTGNMSSGQNVTVWEKRRHETDGNTSQTGHNVTIQIKKGWT
jgi:hypothetical protein